VRRAQAIVTQRAETRLRGSGEQRELERGPKDAPKSFSAFLLDLADPGLIIFAAACLAVVIWAAER
jgi:hypothetical protein